MISFAWLLLAYIPLRAVGNSDLVRGYRMVVRPTKFSHAKNLLASGYSCDFFSDCDIRIRLWANCDYCQTSNEVHYPSFDGSYDNIHNELSIPVGKDYTVVFNTSFEDRITFSIYIEDVDFYTHDEIQQNSHLITTGKLFNQTSNEIAFKNEKHYGTLNAIVSVVCQNNTCRKDCIMITPNLHCDNENMVKCLNTPVEGCNLVAGGFTFRLHISKYGRFTSGSSANCAAVVKVCIGSDYVYCKSEENWVEVIRTNKPLSNKKIDATATHYNDYFRKTDAITYPNVDVNFRVYNACLSVQSFENFTVQLQAGVLEKQNITLEEDGLAGYFQLSCQDKFNGPYCQNSCPNCKVSEELHCVMPGPTCAYKQLCAAGSCLHKANCSLSWSPEKNNYERNCDCLKFFEGNRCEFSNGVICSDNKETCKNGGICSEEKDVHQKWTTNCSCLPGYAGPDCETCVAPVNFSSCSKLLGSYTLLVELLSVINAHGHLHDGKYCDKADSYCDTRVSVLFNNTWEKEILKAANRDNVSRNEIRKGDLYKIYEHNLSSLESGKTLFEVKFKVFDFDPSNLNYVLIAEFEDEVAFNFTPHVPQYKDLNFTSNSGVSVRAVVTLSCARGFSGPGCSSSSNCVAPEELHKKFDEHSSLLKSFNLPCFPRNFVCKDNSLGPSCYLSQCASLSCTNGTQCTIDKSFPRVECKPQLDKCKSGEKICNRHGSCFINESTSKAECKCTAGHGGEDCQIADYCPKSFERSSCGFTRVCIKNVGKWNYYDCKLSNCSNCKAFEYDACNLLSCTTQGVCEYVAKESKFSCKCKRPYSGLYCEEHKFFGAMLSRQPILIAFGAVSVVLIVFAAKRANVIQKKKHSARRSTFEAVNVAPYITDIARRWITKSQSKIELCAADVPTESTKEDYSPPKTLTNSDGVGTMKS